MNKVLQCEIVFFFADVSEEHDFNFSNIKMYSTSSHKQYLGTATDICSTIQCVYYQHVYLIWNLLIQELQQIHLKRFSFQKF